MPTLPITITGVRLVWVVNPIHEVGRPVRTIEEDGVLEGDAVVPGFRCALRDVLD